MNNIIKLDAKRIEKQKTINYNAEILKNYHPENKVSQVEIAARFANQFERDVASQKSYFYSSKLYKTFRRIFPGDVKQKIIDNITWSEATEWIQRTEDKLWVESLFTTLQTKIYGGKIFIKRFIRE